MLRNSILPELFTCITMINITVVCSKDSLRITWRIPEKAVPDAARLFLGNCYPSNLNVASTGEADVVFNYTFSDCRFKKQVKGKYLIYKNELSFRPKPRPNPPVYVFPIQCVTRRSNAWVPHFLNPGSGLSEGRSSLVFNMALLNEDLTGIAKTNVVPLGSFIAIWAAVEQKSHQPLLLLMEECVATTTLELHTNTPRYPIISNQGCLQESVKGNAMFLPRYHSSALIVYLQSFKLNDGDVVYIHCKLVAWDPNSLSDSRKACHYSKESESWELLDDPLQSSLCCNCDNTCDRRKRREVENESHSLSYNSVVGPLFIVDRSDLKTKNKWVGSVPAAGPQME
uniref:Zona pellucida sperm-binding protein 3-like n=1 Tax=Sphaeramia orbicularis TaxID=375764 RepID=A0A673AHN8_9TELE